MLPEGVHIDQGSGGLDRLVIEATDGAAHVYLHGAQVTHFQPRGATRAVLFLSRQSRFEGGAPGKAIRGGIPVCFPWFGPKAGDATAPMHGFARVLKWEVGEVVRETGRGGTRASLRLTGSDYTRRFFPHDFTAVLTLTVAARLRLELAVHNAGPSPMVIEDALHTYFAVGDSRRAAILGLEGAPYIDKTEAFARKPGEATPIAITRETDRVYPGARGTVTIDDPIWGRRIVVEKTGSASTVVWNPWVEKAKGMADFGDAEWTEMVCVETANTGDDAVTIPSGETHVMTATIGVE